MRGSNLSSRRAPPQEIKGARLYIIDGIGPFFGPLDDNRDRGAINWSKIPFGLIERNGRLTGHIRSRITELFACFASQVRAMGYNAVSLDDVAHLAQFEFYPDRLKRKLADYRLLYEEIFRICTAHRLDVFVTTDIMFLNEHIARHVGTKDPARIHFLGRCFRRIFKQFPQVAGAIVRLGESDGVDVENEFQSSLVIRRPKQARTYIRSLLPVFERYDRTMVVRTWTVGAYRIGDLMWNTRTYHRVFRGLDSLNLIVSLKYGESDFYRYLPLNPLFFEGTQRKMIELQARREYEGCGEFPSFVGFDYERYADDLRHHRRLAGICVWCQTGGWARFRRLTFLRNSSLWNEINTYVTIRIFKDHLTGEEAAADFCRRFLPGKDTETMSHLLRLSDRVIKELWYLPDFSQRRLYFRRVRIPPLVWIFWDTIVINHPLRRTIKRLVTDRRESIREGYRCLYKIREMHDLAAELGLDEAPFELQYDTFEVVALAREYILGRWSNELRQRIERRVENYRHEHPDGFVVELDFSPFPMKKLLLKLIFRLCLRPHRHYHMMERVFLIRFTGWFYPLIRVWERRRLPEFTRRQAMGLEVLFK